MDDRQDSAFVSALSGAGSGRTMAPDSIGCFLACFFSFFLFVFILNVLGFGGVLGRDWEIIDLSVTVVSLVLLLILFRKYRGWKAMATEFIRASGFMEDVLACAPPLCITTLDFSIVYVNRAYLDIFHPGGDRPPRHCYDSRPGDRCRSSSCPLEQLRSGRSEAVCETRKRIADGGERVFMISGRPFLNRDGELAGIIEVFTDVTRLKQLEEEVRVQRHLEGLATLAGGMAHDFNNLLTVVFGNQEMAAAMSTEPEVRNVLAESSIALSQARELSTRLLIMADSGMDNTREIGDLIPLAERSFRQGLGEHADKAVFDTGSGLPRVSFVPAQMEQAFTSLAISCLEWMNAGDPILFRSRGVSIGEDNELGLAPGSWLSIWITDPGGGLEPGAVARIFEPYYSVSPMDNRKGRGLGMSLLYAVISRHGGRVLLSSEPGTGSTVRVLLPVAGPVPRGQDRGCFHPVEDGMEVVGEIFILDDDETVAGIIADMLGHLGYASRSFSRGEDLVATFAGLEVSQRPLMVILDLVVPSGFGGLATLRRLQKIAPGVRTMAVSGRSHDEIMKYPREFGFTSALRKPFDFKELKKCLTAAVEDRS